MTELFARLVETLRLEVLVTLLLAVVLGGAVGLERELKRKPAGLRTNILICVGAALFTLLSIAIADGRGDPGRIAAQIVTGVGFLGAGTILHTRGQVSGLTSAATIWLVAAIGMAVGAGAMYEAVGTTVLVLIVLAVLGRVEVYMTTRQDVSRVTLEIEPEPEQVSYLQSIVEDAGLKLNHLHTEHRGDRIVVEIGMRGPRPSHTRAREGLLRSARTLTVDDQE